MISIAHKNIKERKLRTTFTLLSVIIASSTLLLFMGLKDGVKNATFEELEKKSPLTQITVSPKIEDNGIISLLGKSQKNKITQEKIDKIKDIDGVKAVYPEIQFNNFASLEASVFGFSFLTDAMIFGVDEDFVKDDFVTTTDWNSLNQPYPAIIPSKLLDLYNVTIAVPQGLPSLSEDDLKGKKITLYPNYSTFFPGFNKISDSIELKVVGFSDKTNLLGATLSYQAVNQLNQKYSEIKEPQVLELFIETEDASLVKEVADQINTLNLNTQYFQKNAEDIEAKLNYLDMALSILSLIILITTAMAILTTFLATISEQKKEIGLLRALGATKLDIKKMILLQATIIGLVGSAIGLALGILIISLIEPLLLKERAQTTFTPNSLFLISTVSALKILLFGTVLTIFAAYLPAHQAAKVNPIQALKN